MKSATFFICNLTAVLLIVPSIHCCKKYEDGSALSLKSRKERLAHTWKVKSCVIDGNDSTFLFSNYTETFTKDGNYFFSNGNVSGSGHWSFTDRDLQIEISGIENEIPRMLVLTKLEEKEIWYYYYIGSAEKKFQLVRN